MDERLHPTLKDIERAYVLKVLRRCKGNRTQTARQLGISLRGLRDRLHQYAEAGFEVPRPCLGIGAQLKQENIAVMRTGRHQI